jgi:flagellin-like hook-associated protein FlgL
MHRQLLLWSPLRLKQFAGGRAALGAVSNRLEYTVSNLMNVAEYTYRSAIQD